MAQYPQLIVESQLVWNHDHIQKSKPESFFGWVGWAWYQMHPRDPPGIFNRSLRNSNDSVEINVRIRSIPMASRGNQSDQCQLCSSSPNAWPFALKVLKFAKISRWSEHVPNPSNIHSSWIAITLHAQLAISAVWCWPRPSLLLHLPKSAVYFGEERGFEFLNFAVIAWFQRLLTWQGNHPFCWNMKNI